MRRREHFRVFFASDVMIAYAQSPLGTESITKEDSDSMGQTRFGHFFCRTRKVPPLLPTHSMFAKFRYATSVANLERLESV